ncbi:MAG: amidohydrolase family protein [Pseudomonadota bacterium]
MIRFDCHAHVYEQVSAIDGARYVPASPAPLDRWLAYHRQHGLTGGVIVQVSFLGTDNSELCAALGRLDRTRFAGVAVVPLDISGQELDALARAGVRGVRWNLVRNARVPDLEAETVRAFLGKLRDRDLHLEIHLEGPRLATVIDRLTDQGLKIAIDHFGLPSEADPRNDPLVSAVKTLAPHRELFMKFSAHYRTPFDLRPHAEEMLSALSPDRIVWGSDWPHTQHEAIADYSDAYARGRSWGLADDASAVRALYGLASPVRVPG